MYTCPDYWLLLCWSLLVVLDGLPITMYYINSYTMPFAAAQFSGGLFWLTIQHRIICINVLSLSQLSWCNEC